MPPNLAMRYTSTVQVTEQAERIHCICSNTVQPSSVCPNTIKSKPSSHRRVCEPVLLDRLFNNPGSVYTGPTANLNAQNRLTVSCSKIEQVCLADQNDTNKWPCVPADFSKPICLLTSAGTSAMNSHHSVWSRPQLFLSSSNASAFSLADALLEITRCRMAVKSMFSEGTSAALEEHKSKAVHCCL